MSNYYKLQIDDRESGPVNLRKAVRLVIQDPRAKVKDSTGRIVLAKGDIFPFALPKEVKA